jgi:feruloyl-CoA synthase
MLLLEDPPSMDAQETTDKGSVNQGRVLAARASLVEQLYGAAGPGIILATAPASLSRESA